MLCPIIMRMYPRYVPKTTTNADSHNVFAGTLPKSMLATCGMVNGRMMSAAHVNIHLFTVITEYFLTSLLKSAR